jgi:hypothetical protein
MGFSAIQTTTVHKMAGRKPKQVTLNPDDERLLHEIVASPFWSRWQIRRAEAILGMASGARMVELAERLGYSRASIQRTCQTFEREGIGGLMTQRQRTGRPRVHFADGPA